MPKGSILLCAGGTGGHLFPAEALSHELIARGYQTHLATDARAERFAGSFPCSSKRVIRSATMASKNPIAVMRTLWTLFQGYRSSADYIREVRPLAAIGFGGYPTLPPIMAAANTSIPTLVHEQNAILGRANRLLTKKVKGVAVGFPQVGKVPDLPVIETGNPLRPAAIEAAGLAYPERTASEPLRLVIFGGSQGARFFSEALPPALEELSPEMRGRLSILQQAREEDEMELRRAYGALGIEATIAPFFANMPEEIARSHFVIARAGASSVAELALIGRPSLLVPLPGSLDGDQAANAVAMAEAGGAFVVKQAELDARRIADILKTALAEPEALRNMAVAARRTGIPDAAKRLADCVECVISGGDLSSLSF